MKKQIITMESSQFLWPGRGLNLPGAKEFRDQQDDDDKDTTEMKFISDLLKRGEKEIELKDEYKDVILVLGNTGSGKSTFTQWIAGDNSKLIAKEVKEGTGEFIIEDGNRIGNSTIKSKTIFPELVVDADTNTAFYDCPGFSDTRSTSNDIATTYFIKKVVDHAERVKMVFTISYPSVRKGVDRHDFMTLVRHATDLVKDIDKFKNSIAIVATKVDNQYVKQGKSFVLVEDEKVVETIVDFLQEVKEDLVDKTSKEINFHKKATKFIDALLVKDGDHYFKIGLFRRPDEPGPISNITLLQDERNHIKKTMLDGLTFTKKLNNDFGYTVSEKSKNNINDFVEAINKSIWTGVNNVAGEIQTFYSIVLEKVRKKIQSFLESTTTADADKSEAQILSTKLRNGYNVTSNLVEEISNITNPLELAGIISNSITSLNIHASKDVISNIADQGKYFNFLQIISDKTLSTRPWADAFKSTLAIISESRKSVQDDVSNTAEKIVAGIQLELNATAKAMQDLYDEKIKLLEIRELADKLNSDKNSMLNMVEEMKNITTTKEMVKKIYDVGKILDISIPKENIQNITYLGKTFEYVQILSDNKLRTGSTSWVYPFKNMVNYFCESKKWYTWLNDLYGKFSEYRIQKDRYKYNVADLKDWGKSGKPQGIVITAKNFQNFLSKISQFNITEHAAMENITITRLKLDELNNMLSSTLKYTIDIKCAEPYILIKGNYISIQDTMNRIANKVDMDGSCGNFENTVKSKRIKFVNVFAINTVFIDQDWPSLRPGLPISFIAPKWEVIGTRKLDLSGADGEHHTESKAKNGASIGSKGADGEPGRPGKPGGTFFGIGDRFVNGANLTVIADGGRGGPGQSGGDGFKGSSGRSATVPSIENTYCQDGLKQMNGFRCEKIQFYIYWGTCGGLDWRTDCDHGFAYCEYKIFGVPGGKGGDGGNGGRGGKGGKPGNIILFELSDKSQILTTNKEGRDGANGKGGIGGGRGDSGDDVVVSYYSSAAPGAKPQDWKLKQRIKNRGDPSPSGKIGKNGANDAGIQQPEAATVIDGEQAIIINEYKSYLRENLQNRFTNTLLTQFLQQINSNVKVKSVYNTLGLVNEIEGLEKQLYALKKDIDFIPFYEALLNRISEYSQKPKDLEKSRDYKKVLSYLYTATLGRIYNLKENAESSLIIDISGYLEIVKKDIETLKDMQNANNKANIIKKQNENYKKSFDKRIDEAKSFIQKQITPEIDNISSQIDNEIDLLIDEIIELQKQAEKEKQALLRKKQELENALALRGVFSIFKIVGLVVSFLGPVGAAVGAIVETVTSVTESLALDNQQQILPSSVESNVQFARDQIKSINRKKIDRLNGLLEELSQATSEYPEKLGDITVKVADIKIRLNEVDEKRLDFKKTKILEDELKHELKVKEDELQNQKVVIDQKSAKALKVIEKFNQMFEVSSVLLDITRKYESDEAKIDTVNDAIKNSEKKIQSLRQYEENIYDTIVPMLQNMEDNLHDVADKLENKSQVALDIAQWQVQGTLRDMKLKMQKVTNGFEVKDDLARCIEKLEETMNTLINVYDRIESYKEQQNLANYIADISSTTASSIDITDKELINAVNRLDIILRSNLVLQQYKNAVNAFKQWVFPFADHYLDPCKYPPFVETYKSIDYLVSKAVQEIEDMKLKMDLYKTYVNSNDEYIRSGEFNSRYISAEPFFVWKSEQYKGIITNLLAGHEVVLKADVQNSAPDKDAVKFSFIELCFKSKNETLQSQLNNTLKGFEITMKHMGNSYYRYDEKIYLIASDSQSIWYTLEKNDAGEPVRKNDVYSKITKGDLMLSPYALWEIKLANITNKITLHDLEMYRDGINLELSGYGSYVVRDVNVTNNENLIIETSSALKLHIESKTGDCKHSSSSNLYDILSADEIDGVENYVTNAAATRLSSPINYVCNLLKMYVVTNILTSMNEVFINKALKIGNNRDDCHELAGNVMNQSPEVSSHIKTKEKTKQEETNSNTGSSAFFQKRNSKMEVETKKPDCSVISSCKCNNYKSSSKLMLSCEQQAIQYIQFPKVPEINSSLLLADLITRSISGIKYKSATHESLLSAQEVVLRKIDNGLIQSESDIEQNLCSILSETDEDFYEETDTFWFRKVKQCFTSTLQLLGFAKNEDYNRDCNQDVRTLFIQKD